VLLTARARFGNNNPFHRRNDYLISWSFLKLAEEYRKAKSVGFEDPEVRTLYANAATFLSWAFINKREIRDPETDANTPKSLYNLASIYFEYQRYAGAYGAATSGLDFLRINGGSEHRLDLRRMAAEAMVLNRSYLQAVQELDSGIRQDPESNQVAAAFARVGDIYFDLNNYELAEDAYGLAIAIDKDRNRISSAQMILRGEALFWMGRFSDAQKMLAFGLEGQSMLNRLGTLPEGYGSFAQLRMADAYLARASAPQLGPGESKGDLLDKAKLGYFAVENQFPKSDAAKIARVRRACLELPFYEGKNVKHARELLEKSQDTPIVPQAIELAWACRTASYAERERTAEMVNRVRDFANLYPESRFLAALASPVREVQSSQFDALYDRGDTHMALLFFEKNRKALFPKLDKNRREKLFNGYVDTFNSKSAEEFWPEYSKSIETYADLFKSAVFAIEAENGAAKDAKKLGQKWHRENIKIAKQLSRLVPNLSATNLNRKLFSRLLSQDLRGTHLGWMFRLAQDWSGNDVQSVCQLLLPVVSKVARSSDATLPKAQAMAVVLAGVDAYLPGLLETDFDCGAALLEMEGLALNHNIDKYSERWIARTTWPMVPEVVHQLWIASERLAENGRPAIAREIWEHLTSKAPKDLPEVKYSQIRLDPQRTEFEGLWK
jgi:tetratricopeptide (TPR) repeat protein